MTTPDDDGPLSNTFARIVLIDSYERVLLTPATGFEGIDGFEAGTWVVPGGVLGRDEPWDWGARRQLWERTGVEPAEIGPCVWTRRIHFYRDERRLVGVERYYFVKVAPTAIEPGALWPGEPVDSAPHRWWNLFDIEESKGGARFVPADLHARLLALLTTDPPEHPIEVSA